MKNRISAACLLLAATWVGCQDDTTQSSSSTNTTVQSFAACENLTINITEPNPNNIWTPNAIKLVSKEVAPNVFAVYDSNAEAYGPQGIPLATSGGFVIGEKGVLLVETMINRQLFCQFIGLVRERTDKPVTHAINTSSHGDHSFGNSFLPSEVNIVQHEATAAYIAAHFAEDVAFMESNFGKDQGLDEIKPAVADTLVGSDAFVIDLGGISVKAQYHGFAQTDGDLFVEVPSAKVVWTGNPLIAEEPAIPWLLDGHAEESAMTLSAVRAALPGDTIVIPGHGRPIALDGFDFSVKYLETMIGEVQAATDAGLTEEQTVTQVSMEPFQGYKIWGWVHSMVNVPATYKELKP
jgi:cyclase